jgi:hypothetical protein
MSRSRIFFDVAASLDGFIAPEGMDLAHVDEPDYKQWASQWAKLLRDVLPVSSPIPMDRLTIRRNCSIRSSSLPSGLQF